MEAAELFESTVEWLQSHYMNFRLFAERDIVWTVQLRIAQVIEEQNLPYRVFNDHTICGRSADLAILDGDSVAVAAEFKYEPSHERKADRGGDIQPGKFDVVSWAKVVEDVQRVRECAERGNAKVAFSVFVDEGGHFRKHEPHPGSEWIDWGQGVWVLWSQFGATSPRQEQRRCL